MMDAAQLASALGANRPPYQSSRGMTYRGYCPTHDDHRPSLNITAAPNGRTLLKCWAGCDQRELITALVERGLWSSSGSRAAVTRSQSAHEALVAELSSKPLPAVPACCLAGHCEHWDEFDRQFLLANLRGNLEVAIEEIADRHQSDATPLSRGELLAELRFAVDFGAIVPPGISANITNWAIEKTASRMVV